MKNLRSAGVLGVLAAGQLCSSLASAAGFIIPESSVEGIALADAVVANPHVPGAFTYNYASMLLREEASATLDMLAVQLQSSVKPAAPNAALGEIDNQADTALLPALYMTAPLTQYSALGLHIGVPFGLESVWPANTFSQFQSADTVIGAGGAIAGLQPLESSLEVIAISPSIGTRVGRDLALAIGVDYYNIDSVELVTTANRISGDGAETGWNLSAHYRFETWLLGVSYHAAVAARIDGEAQLAGIGQVPLRSQLNLPQRLQVGLGYQATDALFVEFDIEQVGWSTYDSLVLTSTGGALPAGTVFSTTDNHWRDVYNLRFGATYSLNSATQLLLGLAYEQKAQSERYFDASIADADRYLLGIGATHRFADDWLLKVGYQLASNKRRRIAGDDYVAQLAGSGGADADPNGSDAYNGSYDGYIQLFGLGLTKYF